MNITPTSEGLFLLFEGCVCLLYAVIIVLHMFLAQYFEPTIVYTCSFPVEILRWQTLTHRKANNNIFSILSHQLRVLFPLLGVFVAVFDGCTVRTTWDLLSLLWDARGLSSKSGVWCKSSAWYCKLSSPLVLNRVSTHISYQVPGGCARWRLAFFVFINQQNKFNQEIAGTRVYICLLPAYTSIRFSSRIYHTASIPNSLDLTWPAENNASHSNIHSITYTTLYIPSGLASTTCNCIIMVMFRM